MTLKYNYVIPSEVSFSEFSKSIAIAFDFSMKAHFSLVSIHDFLIAIFKETNRT